MNKLPIGVQVYGLRDLLEDTPENFKSVMQQIKDMGYDGVELAGLYGLSPEAVRDTLKEVGLEPVGAHVPLVDMMANAEQVAKDYKLIGCTYIVVPYLPEEFRPLTPGYDRVIPEIKRIGEVMSNYGMTLLYHNHNFEFVKMPNGEYGLDDIYAQIPAEYLQVEPDTCWIKVAEVDPAEYILKYTGRVPIVHLKDFVKEGNPKNLFKLIGIETEEEQDDGDGFFEYRPVGSGQQDWQPILDASIAAGAQWVVVEQDEHYGVGSIAAAKSSIDFLKSVGW